MPTAGPLSLYRGYKGPVVRVAREVVAELIRAAEAQREGRGRDAGQSVRALSLSVAEVKRRCPGVRRWPNSYRVCDENTGYTHLTRKWGLFYAYETEMPKDRAPPSPLPPTLLARGVRIIFLYLAHEMITEISEMFHFQASPLSAGGGTPIRNVHTPVGVAATPHGGERYIVGTHKSTHRLHGGQAGRPTARYRNGVHTLHTFTKRCHAKENTSLSPKNDSTRSVRTTLPVGACVVSSA